MRWLRSLFARRTRVEHPLPAAMTTAAVSREWPIVADALRAEGVERERARAQAVYLAASWVQLEPLVERLVFDGKTQPEVAALAKITAEQSRALIVAAVVAQRSTHGAQIQ